MEAYAAHVGDADPGAVPQPVVPAEDYEAGIAPPAAPSARPGWPALLTIGILAALVAASVFFGGHAATGEEISLLGPPVPHDRPLGLFGGGEGTNLWADIGMQIALSFLMPLVSAAATAAVGWIVWQWNRLLKADFDAKSAEALHAALERGMLAAIEAFGPRTNKTKLISTSADYAETFNGGTIKRLGLSRESLEQLALPHLASVRKRS